MKYEKYQECVHSKSSNQDALAKYAHDAWIGWIRYLFEKSVHNDDGTITIPSWAVSRWNLQMNTPYQDLPDEMKESDLKEADEMLKIIWG